MRTARSIGNWLAVLRSQATGLHYKKASPTKECHDFEGLNLTSTFAEYVEADDNVVICGEVSLDDAIDEAWPTADTAVTSDEDDDVATHAVPVPTTFAKVLQHIDSIRNFICSCDATEDLLLDIGQLEQKLLVHGPNKVQKNYFF